MFAAVSAQPPRLLYNWEGATKISRILSAKHLILLCCPRPAPPSQPDLLTVLITDRHYRLGCNLRKSLITYRSSDCSWREKQWGWCIFTRLHVWHRARGASHMCDCKSSRWPRTRRRINNPCENWQRLRGTWQDGAQKLVLVFPGT